MADPGFQVRGGAHLKKLRRAEGGAKNLGVFRVKNHDFTPKNHIYSNCGGRREHFWGISCEKSRFYAKKIIFFQILGGVGCAPGAQPPPPGSAPVLCGNQNKMDDTKTHTGSLNELFFITNVHFCISSILKFYSHSDRLTSNYLNKCMQ